MKAEAEEYYDNNQQKDEYFLLNRLDPATSKQVISIMEAYHQEQMKQQWISVENRLPELEIDDGEFKSSKEVIARFYRDGSAWFESVALKLWYESDSPDWYYVYDSEIASGKWLTHWMPIPER